MRRILVSIALTMLSSIALAQTEAGTITVSGTGSAKAIPDRASVQMSIVARSATVSEAQSAAADVTAKVLEMTDDLDIDRDAVDTTGSSVQPDYRWNREREEQELRGYIAERQIRVELHDLEKLGELVEGAVRVGVNQVSPPQLDSSKRRDAYREALDAAAQDARANARQLATSLGATLGAVLQITTLSQPTPPMPYARTMAVDAMEASAPQTYNAASLDFDATITAVFEIKE